MTRVSCMQPEALLLLWVLVHRISPLACLPENAVSFHNQPHQWPVNCSSFSVTYSWCFSCASLGMSLVLRWADRGPTLLKQKWILFWLRLACLTVDPEEQWRWCKSRGAGEDNHTARVQGSAELQSGTAACDANTIQCQQQCQERLC